MKRNYLIIGGVLLLIALVTGGLILFLPKEETSKETTLIIEINPKLMLVINEDNVVTKMYQLNSDAKIYLEKDLKGKSIKEAMTKIVETSKENGYLKDGKISVSAMEEKNTKVLKEAVKTLEKQNLIVTQKELTSEEKNVVNNAVEEKKMLENDSTEKTIEPNSTDSGEHKNEENKVVEKTPEKAVEKEIPKYDFVLSQNLTVTIEEFGDISYVYPQNPECVGKDPWGITIPEGQTYDTYCNNQVPNLSEVVNGKGYYCTLSDQMSDGAMSMSGEYYCRVIKEIVSPETVSEKIKKIKEKNNAIPVAGGRGEIRTVSLTRELCDKFQLICGD